MRPWIPAHFPARGWAVALCLAVGAAAGAFAAALIRLLLGVLGAVFPQLLGIGYDTLEPLLAGELTAPALLLALALGKALAMAISFGSGFLGGFFAPALFIGAALGGAFGHGLRQLLPALEVEPALLAVAGMAALLAGGVRAPVTAVLLIAGLAGSAALPLPLLLSAGAAYFTSHALERHSLYTYGIAHPAARPPMLHRCGEPESDVRGGVEAVE